MGHAVACDLQRPDQASVLLLGQDVALLQGFGRVEDFAAKLFKEAGGRVALVTPLAVSLQLPLLNIAACMKVGLIAEMSRHESGDAGHNGVEALR